MFKTGDKVRLKARYYNEESFKRLPREQRKFISGLKIETYVRDSIDYDSYSIVNYGLLALVPTNLLERVDFDFICAFKTPLSYTCTTTIPFTLVGKEQKEEKES